MKNFWELYLSFLNIGALMFGSGYTMLPLLTRDVTETGLVQAIDFDGKPIWQDQILDERSKPIKVYSNPVAAGNTILVAPFGNSSNMLIAYDTNGAKKWTFAPSK